MALHGKTYQPVQKLTVEAKEDLTAFRFVSHLGSVCASGTKALGVADTDWLDGEMASVISLGTVPVETTTSVNIGDEIAVDTEGKARTAAGLDKANGRALNSTTGAGFITISLIP